jgi:hypothetical protein
MGKYGSMRLQQRPGAGPVPMPPRWIRFALTHPARIAGWTPRRSFKPLRITDDLTGTDVYKRHLGSCSVGGEDVSRWLVCNGWGLAFRRYSTAYVADEDYARVQKRGLWSGAFIAPWEWRHRSSATVVLVR